MCQTGLPGNASQQRKRHTGHLRGPPEGQFCTPYVAQIDPRGDSKMTPRGVVYRFLCWLAFLGRPVWYTILTGKSPELPKSAQNRGYLPFGHFFRKFPPFQGAYVAVGPKKCGNPPGGSSAGGCRTFWSLLAPRPPEKGELPRTVFWGGAPLNPL